jgi:hypothetical protein
MGRAPRGVRQIAWCQLSYFSENDQAICDKYRTGGYCVLWPLVSGLEEPPPFINAGVPYATVKKFGRWRSDSVLLYYRDEDEVVYRRRSGVLAGAQRTAISDDVSH